MRRLLPMAAVFLALAGPVSAECYADYKASQSDPLRLHYGVVELDPEGECSVAAAEPQVRDRLPDPWNLLQVMDVFGPEGLEERRESAGDFYLRF